MPKSLNRQQELRQLLEHLNLGGMASIFAEVALRAAKENLSHEAYLWELAANEYDLRIQRRTARLLRLSSLPQEKTFRTFDGGEVVKELCGGALLNRVEDLRVDAGGDTPLAGLGQRLGRQHHLCDRAAARPRIRGVRDSQGRARKPRQR